MSILDFLIQQKQNRKKGLAILIDPDQHNNSTTEIYYQAKKCGIDLFLIGGSILSNGVTQDVVNSLKSLGAEKVVLFPGNEIQLVENADAILFMSLISGRNPEYLIGKQVIAAPWIKKHKIESISTGYMLIESGKLTSALYISGTLPLPSDKPDIAAATAMAGELLGMKLIYLDAGSGAKNPASGSVISAINSNTDCLLFVGGGITNPEQAKQAWENGADYVVVGNGIFENFNLISKLADALSIQNSNPNT
jgi:putative glycerol-1-phosphate prenyltransferase